jgi:hypothetical protein
MNRAILSSAFVILAGLAAIPPVEAETCTAIFLCAEANAAAWDVAESSCGGPVINGDCHWTAGTGVVKALALVDGTLDRFVEGSRRGGDTCQGTFSCILNDGQYVYVSSGGPLCVRITVEASEFGLLSVSETDFASC